VVTVFVSVSCGAFRWSTCRSIVQSAEHFLTTPHRICLDQYRPRMTAADGHLERVMRFENASLLELFFLQPLLPFRRRLQLVSRNVNSDIVLDK
jgi:hypothetical protein